MRNGAERNFYIDYAAYCNQPSFFKREEYVIVEVTIIKANNDEVEETDDFPTHYTDENINEVLWDKYTDKYGEFKEIKWKQM